jgi:cytochrome c5
MSDPHNEHESGIRTPKQLIAAIVAAFVIPIICIVLLVQYVTNNHTDGAGSEAQSNDAIVARIKPVADQGFTLIDVNAPRVFQTGTEVYKAVCSACHTAGVAGAPKMGDKAAWSARIAQGYDTLVAHAIGGIRGMPAKGGNPDLDDIEVARAVAYLANQAGATFKEPEAKVVAVPPVTAAAPDAAAPKDASAATPATPAAALPTVSAAPMSSAQAAPAAAVAPVPPAKLSADAGKKLYEGVCQACHAAGIAGSPKFGDKLAWAERLKQGPEVLYAHAIKGFQGKAGVMPAKGGSAASDEEVKAAVDYMAAAAK